MYSLVSMRANLAVLRIFVVVRLNAHGLLGNSVHVCEVLMKLVSLGVCICWWFSLCICFPLMRELSVLFVL